MTATAQATSDGAAVALRAAAPAAGSVQKHRYYWNHIGELKRELGTALTRLFLNPP